MDSLVLKDIPKLERSQLSTLKFVGNGADKVIYGKSTKGFYSIQKVYKQGILFTITNSQHGTDIRTIHPYDFTEYHRAYIRKDKLRVVYFLGEKSVAGTDFEGIYKIFKLLLDLDKHAGLVARIDKN